MRQTANSSAETITIIFCWTAPLALEIDRPSFAYDVLCIFIMIFNSGRALLLVNTLLWDEYCWRWSVTTMSEHWSRMNSPVVNGIGTYITHIANPIRATLPQTNAIPDPSLSTSVITYFFHKYDSSSYIGTIFSSWTYSSVRTDTEVIDH